MVFFIFNSIDKNKLSLKINTQILWNHESIWFLDAVLDDSKILFYHD
jgi:hypothetical protein